MTHFNPPKPDKCFDMGHKTWDEDAYANRPLQIGFEGYIPKSGVSFIEACEAANILIVDDLNSGDGVGIKQGSGSLYVKLCRSSSYDAFYKPIKDRQNLDVLHYASVQNLIFDEESKGPKVSGVGFVYQPDGLAYELEAKKEVVVSMGAFHSSQLLMVSVRRCHYGMGVRNKRADGCGRVSARRRNWRNLASRLLFSMKPWGSSRLINLLV